MGMNRYELRTCSAARPYSHAVINYGLLNNRPPCNIHSRLSPKEHPDISKRSAPQISGHVRLILILIPGLGFYVGYVQPPPGLRGLSVIRKNSRKEQAKAQKCALFIISKLYMYHGHH